MPTPMQAAIMSSGAPAAYVDMWFAANTYRVAGVTSGDLPLVTGFTFTGASLRTMFDSTGAMTYGPNNLLTYSQDQSNASWTKSEATVSVATAPDGTSTAYKFTPSTNAANHFLEQSPSGSASNHTFSVYAKQAGYRYLVLLTPSGNISFDLQAGSVATVGAGTASMTDAGNGWYRCATTIAIVAGGTVYISGGSSSAAAFWAGAGDGTSGIYLWGAQLEAVTYATTPSTYYPTTSAAYYGPRLVYDPVTLASLGILVEEARTNLCLQSQDFNTTWVKEDTTVTVNATTSPDGTANADKLVEAATTANHRARQAVTISNTTVYTYSAYVKAAERTWAFFEVISGATDIYCYLNLSTGALGTSNTTPTVTSVGNGWYRVSITFTSAAASVTCYNQTSTGNGVTSYAGDGTSGIYLWQAQLEAGIGASSAIVTTSAAVTRAADVPLEAGLAVTNPHTVVAEWTPGFDNASSFRRVGALTDSGLTQEDVIYQRHTTNSARALQSVSMDLTLGTANSATANRAAARFETNNSTGSLNGASAVAPDTNVTPLSGIDRLYIGLGSTASNWMNGTISRIRIYNRALNDAQLQALTA